MEKRKKITILLIVLSAAAFLMTLHPRSVLITYATEDGAGFPVYYYHLSKTPLKYGNPGPILTWISILLSALASVVQLVTGRPIAYKWVLGFSVAAVAGCLLNLLSGSMTSIGFGILALMAVSAGFAWKAGKI